MAAFLALLWPRLKGREPAAIAVVCALATVLAVPFVPAGVPILIAAVVAAVIGWFSHGRSDEGLEPDVDPYAEAPPPPTAVPRPHRRRAHEPLDLVAAASCCLLTRGSWWATSCPAKLLQNPRMSRVAGTMTIGLLASLTVVNAVASGQSLAADAGWEPSRRQPSRWLSGRRSWWWCWPAPGPPQSFGCSDGTDGTRHVTRASGDAEHGGGTMSLAKQLAMDRLCWSGDHGKPAARSRRQIRTPVKMASTKRRAGQPVKKFFSRFRSLSDVPAADLEMLSERITMALDLGQEPMSGAPRSGTPRTANRESALND